MKSSQSSFNEFEYYITPSDMIEFLYCKRFIYYMKSLYIPQFEGNRFKVQKGRAIHERKENENKQYLRKKLGVVDKKIDVDLYSKTFKIKGIVDEVLTLEMNLWQLLIINLQNMMNLSIRHIKHRCCYIH